MDKYLVPKICLVEKLYHCFWLQKAVTLLNL